MDVNEATRQTPAERAALVASLDREQAIAQRETLRGQVLRDPDPDVRAAAAGVLGFVAHDWESVPTLVTALAAEQDPEVQLRLVAVLAGFNDADSIDAVVRFWLGGPAPGIEQEVLGALLGADPRLVRPALDRHSATDIERAEAVRSRLP